MFSNVANAPAKLIDKHKATKIPAFKAAYVQESFFIGDKYLKDLISIKSKTKLSEISFHCCNLLPRMSSLPLNQAEIPIHGILQTLSEK